MMINKVEEIKSKKKKTFQELIEECMNDEGVINLSKMEELEGSCGSNGGKGCDVTEGPCNCGAWH